MMLTSEVTGTAAGAGIVNVAGGAPADRPVETSGPVALANGALAGAATNTPQ